MIKEQKQTGVDHLVRLSESKLWKQQTDFYTSSGIEAWNNKIPFYATSSAYIGYTYALLIINYIKDCVELKQHVPLEPFYVMEIGSGSGQFGFHTIRQLHELRKQMNLEKVPIVYVMTDVVEKNIDFWQKHPVLQPYIQSGVLDFAHFDILNTDTITLINSGRILQPPKEGKTNGNPLIVLANYVFDSLPVDIFKIENRKVQEVLVDKNKEAIFPQGYSTNLASNLSAIGLEPHFKEISGQYYTDPDKNAVLNSYFNNTEQGWILFPSGAMDAVNYLARLSGNRLFLLVTDKGFSHHASSFFRSEPEMMLHDGAFSFMTNFHALGMQFIQKGGGFKHQEIQQSLLTEAFFLGIEQEKLLNTNQAFSVMTKSHSVAAMFNIYSFLSSNRHNCPADTFIGFLEMSRWDAVVFNVFADMLPVYRQNGPSTTIEDLSIHLEKVADTFYYLPDCKDTLAELGVFYQELKDYSKAMFYYRLSGIYFKKQDYVLYNMGLCHYFLKEYDEARALFKAVLEMTPNYIMAKGWLQQINEEMQVIQPEPGITV